jgi:hypothetical protein
MLPHDLQWPKDNPSGVPPSPPFVTDLEKEPIHYLYTFDIQAALLRTRYYYAKYRLYRPFVYKTLHLPEQMTQEDAEGVADCLRVHLLSFFFILSTRSKELLTRPFAYR